VGKEGIFELADRIDERYGGGCSFDFDYYRNIKDGQELLRCASRVLEPFDPKRSHDFKEAAKSPCDADGSTTVARALRELTSDERVAALARLIEDD